MPHFADRLTAACQGKGTPLCVGIDPVYDRLPAELRQGDDLAAQVAATRTFCLEVVRLVAPLVAVIKPQSACFERFGWRGVQVLEEVIADARQRGIIVILDAKRGDIGSTSEHYALGLLQGAEPACGADALTVNSYLGADGIEPFVKVAAVQDKGLFALVRTSNPGGDALQTPRLTDGRTVAQSVGDMVAQTGAGQPPYLGSTGYSLLGAVVGATKVDELAQWRQRLPQQIFLVPGLGAQGGKASDLRTCFHFHHGHATGAILNASRSVLFAYEKPATSDWRGAITAATVKTKAEIAAALG